MNRIFQRTIWSVMIITLGLSVALCGYDTYVYFYNQAIYKEVEQETAIRTTKLEKEATRLRALAEKSHEKCPSQLTLEAHAFNGIKMPAYPHLSAIYVYIHPKVQRAKKHKGSYSPLSEEELQKVVRHSYSDNGRSLSSRSSVQTLHSTMIPLFIEALEQSLAYCGVNKNGTPLKVNIVDKIQHANLEQKDALTIVLGLILHKRVTADYLSYSTRYSVNLHTSQYIPRWKVFPREFKITRNPNYSRKNAVIARRKFVDNPAFRMHDFQASRSYRLFSPLTPKEKSIDAWIAIMWSKKIQGHQISRPLISQGQSTRITKKYFMNLRRRSHGLVQRGYDSGIFH